MATVREITIAQLDTALGGSTPPYLVDVRELCEFASGHVPGAVNLPLDELDTRLGELPRAAPIAVICQSGRRSARAAADLAAAGYHAVSVAGGTAAWAESGRPTRTT